ncbi:MAG: hypothetical protein IT425_06190 [Pirellulales bacterium]|nr:hypothetical protein [Pirellulales bacterium]
MQQYRVNYRLLVGLVAGAIVTAGLVGVIWKVQLSRSSGWLLSEGDRAAKEGDLRKARDYYSQYLAIQNEDDEARFKYANAAIDICMGDNVTYEDFMKAHQFIDPMLRNKKHNSKPEAKKVRRRAVDMYGQDKVGNWSVALDHLELLLAEDPKNAELQSLRAKFLFRSKDIAKATEYSYGLIGYDPKTNKFDVKKATAPNEVEIYSNLAAAVRAKEEKSEFAERILDQMVEVNPQSAEAYVQRGALHEAWGNVGAAKTDAEKAYSLNPDNLEVLLFMASIEGREKNSDKAREYVERAKKIAPEDIRPYRNAANIEQNANQTKKAIAQLDEGIKNVTQGNGRASLLLAKCELLLFQNDVKSARQTLEDLRKISNISAELLEYQEARLLMNEGKWFQATEALNKLRPRLAALGPERKVILDYSLGLCYENLGQPDRAREQFEMVLQQDSQNEPARLGVQRISAQQGLANQETEVQGWQGDLQEELKKPKEQQDVAKLSRIVEEIAEKRKLDPTQKCLLEAQFAMMREDFDAAGKKVAEARQLSPDNLQAMRAAIALARVNPKMGPEVALQGLEKAVAQFGDLPPLRLDRADILIQQAKDKEDKEPLKQQLATLLTDLDAWTPAQKSELWGGMLGRYLSLNMREEARQCLAHSVEAQPNELKLRLALFSLALDTGDEEGMKEAQDKILEIVKDRSDSNWLYTEARRHLLQMRRGTLGPDAIPAIRQLAADALRQRPNWAELHSLMAEIELLANNVERATQYYDQAEQLGRPTPSAVATHIRLLASVGRFAEAGKLLDRIPEASRETLLGPLYAEVLFRSNQTEAALKQAKAATEADPASAQNQYWYGQLLARSSQAPKLSASQRNAVMENAVKAMQRATEIQPEFPDAWFALINYYVLLKDEDQAQKALRDAQLALSGDNLAIFLARSYEVLHRWLDAETMYRQLYDAKPDDVGRIQQLAAFYLGPLYQRPDKLAKATTLLNQILKAGAEQKIPPTDSNLIWARRKAAMLLAGTQDYQKILKAEKLLASNSREGSLLIEDKLAMAEILAKRPEPLSRRKAITLLEEVAKVQPLNEAAETQLGELYFAVGDGWPKYESQMNKTISLNPNFAPARQVFARRWLDRGDRRSLDQAATQISKLRELAPGDFSTFELTVRLASKLGKQQQMRNELINRLPKLPEVGDISLAQAQQLLAFANLLIELGDLDSAEKIYQDLAARNSAMVFPLARFLGQYRDPELCFAKLNEVYKASNATQVLEVALGVARSLRDKIGDKYDADIQRWLDSAFRENPDSIPLAMSQADLYDLQKKYEEAAEAYRKLLKRDDLVDVRRAIVLNNLSFLVALAGPAAGTDDDALKLVQEAADIMGPNSDILDTRAVVYIAKKQYAPAIQDLEMSVTDSPTASKYYHKALAHYLAKDTSAAVEAWEKAEGMGLNHDAINRMEFGQYDDLKAKIEQLRKRAVTQAEGGRKAG